MGTRRVPWYSWEEWESVYELLFSPSIEDMRLGVNWVNVWISRGRVPAAIEATLALIDLLYLNNQKKNSFSNDWSQRLTLSMVICRLVNGITDKSQTKMYAQSVSSIAKELNLPQSWVDIRHSATHKTLPSLSVLMKEANRALDWLKTNYWLAQKTKRENSLSIVSSALSSYYNSTLDYLLSSSPSSSQSNFINYSNKKIKKELLAPLFSICSSSSDNSISQFLIPCLLNNNNNKSNKKNKNNNFNSQNKLEEERGILPSKSILSSTSPSSPINQWFIAMNQMIDQFLASKITKKISLSSNVSTGASSVSSASSLSSIIRFLPPAQLISIWKPAFDIFSNQWQNFSSSFLTHILEKIIFLSSTLEKTNIGKNTKKNNEEKLEYKQAIILSSWLNYILIQINSSLILSTSKNSNKKTKNNIFNNYSFLFTSSNSPSAPSLSSNTPKQPNYIYLIQRCLTFPSKISLLSLRILLFHYLLNNNNNDGVNQNEVSNFMENVQTCYSAALLFIPSSSPSIPLDNRNLDNENDNFIQQINSNLSFDLSLSSIENFLNSQLNNDNDNNNENITMSDEIDCEEEENWKVENDQFLNITPIGSLINKGEMSTENTENLLLPSFLDSFFESALSNRTSSNGSFYFFIWFLL